jgi:peptidoglycan L-alanyl-D-glutamate endopeptidase CwlK
MPRFSKASAEKLATCHPDLQRLFNEVIKHWDCSIVHGHRSVAEQQALYAQGRTMPGPVVTQMDGNLRKSMHNHLPSMAVDVAPYPIAWGDTNRFFAFAGFVIGTAKQLGLNVRWGGDWDGDRDFHDQNLNDYPHFELHR